MSGARDGEPPPGPPPPAWEPPPDAGAADDPLGSRSIALYFKDTLSLLDDPDVATAAPLSPPPLPPKGNRYRLISELGRGGFATVYLVDDRQLKRTVALKLLRLGGKGRAGIERFFEEARSTARLEHPNIVPVYDVGELKGIPFYTMKFVRGRSFAAIFHGLRTGHPEIRKEWTLTRLVQVLLQIAIAAHYAHEKGLVHRDLKPGNVMLGAFGEVLVMDWGLSHAIASAGGRRGLLGTPVYMAPEQALGRLDEVDARTDVYALGVMLFEALTLRRPFEGRDVRKLLREISTQAPPTPAELARDRAIPPALAAIALRALAKDKLTRQQTARRFYDELQGWFEAETEHQRRVELSAARLQDGSEKLRRYRALQAEIAGAQAELRALQSSFRGPEPLAEKAALLVAEDRIQALRRERVRLSSGAMSALTEALAFHSASPEARRRIAEYYLLRFEESEAAGDGEGQAFFAELVRRYDGGALRERLHDEGELSVVTEPPGLSAALLRHVEDGFVLRTRPEVALGLTPVRSLAHAAGSYVVRILAPGGEVSAPVELVRGAEARLVVNAGLRPPPGFVLVPGGPFRSGPPPGIVRSCGDFAMARFPVTLGAWLEYLEWLGREAPDEARARTPRLSGESSPLVRFEDGRALPPGRLANGPPWPADAPVLAISWHDARAYATWLGQRDGIRLDLPTSLEWEKAARGTDGRRHPWGNRFDPALANMKRSLDAPRPVPVQEFATDVSPYGIRGLGGNVRDWCADAAEEGDESREERVVRGGAWSLGAGCVDAWSVGGLPADMTSSQIGFRLVWRP